MTRSRLSAIEMLNCCKISIPLTRFVSLLFWLESPANPKHVAIRMAKVHFADIPRHIGGRKCNLECGCNTLLVHLIHVVHPDRHPDALVAPLRLPSAETSWCSRPDRLRP